MKAPGLAAAYVGVLRHELRVPRGTDALDELAHRLAPPDPGERPPARAPGIARLAAALRRLRAGRAPACSLEQFTDDLRFLRLFEGGLDDWPADAVGRLLAELAPPRPRRTQEPRAPARTGGTVTPLKRRRTRGDA